MANQPTGAVIQQGTLPTPSDPYPSNVITTLYPNDRCDVTFPLPTPEVLKEYQDALQKDPQDGGLHLHYALALRHSDSAAALAQAQEAVRLAPTDEFAHSTLGIMLRAAGEGEAALAEYRTALALKRNQQLSAPDQSEVTLRWGLAQVLQQIGNVEEAQAELQQAVALQRELVARKQGSPQLLQQLEDDQHK